jgi:hypothetical protein
MKTREDVISKLMDKSMRLSYSTLKNFTSPTNIVNYKLKKYTQNPSMLFGSLCDMLLLTPEDFDNYFLVIDKIPSSELQIGFANEVVDYIKSREDKDLSDPSEEILSTIFDNHYKRGSAEKTFNELSEYIFAKVKGLQLVSHELLYEAKEVCENLMKNKDIEFLFSKMKESQKKVSWKDEGWSFIGFLDMYLEDHIIDLKFSKDSNPEKFERDIANFDYFLQAGMYCYALKEMGICDNPKYSFIVYDKSFNYSVIELDYSYIKYGERKYKYLLQELNRCIEEDNFDKSYGFFNRSYRVAKPKWAKGYVLNEDE